MRRGQREPSRRRLSRRARRILVRAGGAVAVVVLLLVAYRWATSRPGESFADLGNDHLRSLDDKHVPYNSDPPTSGPHVDYITHWGVHTEPIPKELQVHNLEDGGVLVQYNCPGSCADLVVKLRSIVARYDRMVILAPYPGMDKRIALTAWRRLDKLDDFDRQRIVRFIEAYRGIDHHRRALFW